MSESRSLFNKCTLSLRLSTSESNLNDRLPLTKNERLDAFRGEPLQDADVERLASHMLLLLLLLLLTPNEILKKTENRVLLSVSELMPMPPDTAI